MAQTITVPVGDSILSIEWITYNGQAWLVPAWILSPDGKTQRPLRLIAPKFAPGVQPIPGPEMLGVFQQGILLTEALLERGEIPPQLEKLVEILEEPDISLPNPELSH
jgi:hypothetical protein